MTLSKAIVWGHIRKQWFICHGGNEGFYSRGGCVSVIIIWFKGYGAVIPFVVEDNAVDDDNNNDIKEAMILHSYLLGWKGWISTEWSCHGF